MPSFLSLPIEIRDTIYRLCLDDGRVNAAPQWYHRVGGERSATALMRVSRQTRAEFGRHLAAQTWVVTPQAAPFLVADEAAVQTVALELHFLDGLSRRAGLDELAVMVPRHYKPDPSNPTYYSKTHLRSEAHNKIKAHTLAAWLEKFQVAVATKAPTVKIDATNAYCMFGCCRLILDLQRRAKEQYDIDEIKGTGEKGPMKASIVTCMGRNVEFNGAEGPSEASRLLNVFRLVAGHGSTPKD